MYHCPSDAGKLNGPSYAINGWLEYGFSEAAMNQPTQTVILGEKATEIGEEHFLWWTAPWPAWPPVQDASITAHRYCAESD